MPKQVCMTAILQCSFGVAPSSLVVVPKGPPVNTEKKFAATIMDYVPIVNILPFGVCSSIANPTVVCSHSRSIRRFNPNALYSCHPCTLGARSN